MIAGDRYSSPLDLGKTEKCREKSVGAAHVSAGKAEV